MSEPRWPHRPYLRRAPDFQPYQPPPAIPPTPAFPVWARVLVVMLVLVVALAWFVLGLPWP